MRMDKRALKILFDAYWSPAGWRPGNVSPEDFSYAKAAGVMFDPIPLTHNEVVRRAIAIRDTLTPRQVANGFLASLSSRRLELRSALGSYAVLRHLPAHESFEKQCQTCGMYNSDVPEDLNVLSFERFKWGGVRHAHPEYALFDLEQFAALPCPDPSTEDKRLFRELINVIELVPQDATATTLSKHFSVAGFKSSKAERDVFIEILGMCSVLQTAAHPGFSANWISYCDRELPSRRFVDMAYPACWWRRSDGVNPDALKLYFSHVL